MHAFENHGQWTAVKETIERLKSAGYRGVLAGGCVRDLLLGREPNDFDIATDATPDQVESLFEKSVSVGKAFGVIVLPFEGFQLEVATFREDLEYRDGRRPEGVRFSDMEADAKRRDFTINALFYDIESESVLDFVDGQNDLRNQLIRAVGDPDRRFDEDKLRLLRAVRFAAQMDFPIEDETYRAVLRRATEVRVVSQERIRDELTKLLKQPAPGRRRGLELLISTGLLAALFPALTEEARDQKWWASLLSLPEKAESAVIFALLLFPLYRPPNEKDFRDLYLRPLKLDTRTMEAVLFSLRNLPVFSQPSSIRKGEMALRLARPEAATATVVAFARGAQTQEQLNTLRLETLDFAGQLPRPFVTGEDLLRAGLQRGPKMGEILNSFYLDQIEGLFESREVALKELASRLGQTPSEP